VKYKAYPSYKDSGVEWLGEVPESWVVTKIKNVAPFQVGWTPPTKDESNFDGENIWVTIGDLKRKVIISSTASISDQAAEKASMSISPKGSLLFSFKLSVATVAFAGRGLYTNEAIASFLDNEKTNLSYLYYSNPLYILQNATENIYGAKILNQELIKNALLSIPSYKEQKTIANYLDKATAKIDTLIEKQTKLIALLKEKRQAVISSAVTLGLDASVPMKDSGVEWLGEIPEHWVSCFFKYKTKKITDGAHVSPDLTNGKHYFLSVKDTTSGEVDFTNALLTSEASFKYLVKTGCKPKKGDVLFGKDGTIGVTSVVKGDEAFVVASSLIIITPRKGTHSEYLNFVCKSNYFKEQVNSFVKGAALKRMSIQNMLKIWAVFPDYDEQVIILNFLNIKTTKIDNLITKSTQSIGLLKEKRTALISACVTGKIDVRDAA